MQPNPFAPPLALVEDIPDDTLAGGPPRPLSVWTVQVLAALLAGLIVCLLVVLVEAQYSQDFAYWPSALTKAAVAVSLAGVLVAIVVGSQRRRRLARWGGLAFIAAVFALFAWLAVIALGTAAHALGTLATPSSIGAGLVISILTLAPTAFWFWAFGFSAKSRAWFDLDATISRTGPSP